VLKRLLVLAATGVVGGVLVGGSVAAPAEVVHFSEGPFPAEFCGISGTTVTEGTSVFLEREDTFFASGNFSLVFTADTGKSITISAAGPVKAPLA
jgi:hypothetical protein